MKKLLRKRLRKNPPVFGIVLAAMIGLAVLVAFGQEPAAAPFKPTEVQSLRLQVKQRDARLAQIEAERAVNNLAAECHKVRDDNKWPTTVECDFNTLTFVDMKPPTEAAKPEAPKLEPPKAAIKPEPKKK